MIVKKDLFIVLGGLDMSSPINNYTAEASSASYSSSEEDIVSQYDSDAPPEELMELNMDDLARALRNQVDDEVAMPRQMRSVVDKVFNLIDITNVGLGAALSFVGWGISLFGVATIAHTCFTLPSEMYSTNGFNLLYTELMESAAIPTLLMGIALTILGRDFAHGQEMIQGIARNIPYMLSQALFGAVDPYRDQHGYGGRIPNNPPATRVIF
jgi:hypothetical protein